MLNRSILYCIALAVAATATQPLHAQIDCLGVNGGTALPGTACDDHNTFTQNDIWYPGCICIGQCDFIGGSCDDANVLTVNDAMTACGCIGTCVWAFGMPCDDQNPYTSNDTYWPNWCACFGMCDMPPGTLCDDGDPLTTGEFLDTQCRCVAGSNQVNGRVFLDMDGNGTFGAGDVPLPNRWVHFGSYHYTVSDTSGNFFIDLPSGTYQITAQSGTYDVPAQGPILVDLNGQGLLSSGHEIAMTPVAMQADLAARVCTSPHAPPGFLHYVFPICLNRGTLPTSGSMSLTNDPLSTFIATDDFATVSGNILTWNVPILQPGQRYRGTAVTMTPVGTPLATILQQQVVVSAAPPDPVAANDTLNWSVPVMGSWDPNDKQVTPTSLTPDELTAGKPVEYTIRFQNTGTLAAQNVRITDALPAGVDPATFEFLGSSHMCHTQYHDGVLEFRFENIMLPDSGADELASHGFVMFRIKPISTLLPGDSVWNRAYIYFDFNEPVVTNAATFRVELSTDVAPDPSQVITLSLWPNPATDVLSFWMDGALHANAVTIIDMNGRVARSIPIGAVRQGTSMIPVADLADGLYTLRLVGAGSEIDRRFAKTH